MTSTTLTRRKKTLSKFRVRRRRRRCQCQTTMLDKDPLSRVISHTAHFICSTFSAILLVVPLISMDCRQMKGQKGPRPIRRQSVRRQSAPHHQRPQSHRPLERLPPLPGSVRSFLVVVVLTSKQTLMVMVTAGVSVRTSLL